MSKTLTLKKGITSIIALIRQAYSFKEGITSTIDLIRESAYIQPIQYGPNTDSAGSRDYVQGLDDPSPGHLRVVGLA